MIYRSEIITALDVPSAILRLGPLDVPMRGSMPADLETLEGELAAVFAHWLTRNGVDVVR